MTNYDFIEQFTDAGFKGIRHLNHLTAIENRLYNYDALICIIDRSGKKADLNVKKYSVTTSRIQSHTKWILKQAGFSITESEFENDNFQGIWNYGYMGAEKNSKYFKLR